MAPSELMSKGGIIWWGHYNNEPGIEWLRRLKKHFTHSVWLTPVPREEWDYTWGRYTMEQIQKVFPMFELTVDGLTQAVRSLMVRK